MRSDTRLTPLPPEADSTLARSDPEWVALFRESALREPRVRASTLEAYTRDLAMLCRWAALQDQALVDVDASALRRYVLERAAQGTQPSTLARQLSTYRRFYSFLLDHGAIAANPAAAVLVAPVQKPQSGLVRDDVMRRLLRGPRGEFPSPASAYRARRDHAMVCMLYGTSLGISDVRLLRWQQIDELWHVVRTMPGNRPARSFVLDATLLAVLMGLRKAAASNSFGLDNSPYCFPTASGLPMTRQALCYLVRKRATDCGHARAVTPSVLRQTGRANSVVRRRSPLVPAAS